MMQIMNSITDKPDWDSKVDTCEPDQNRLDAMTDIIGIQ